MAVGDVITAQTIEFRPADHDYWLRFPCTSKADGSGVDVSTGNYRLIVTIKAKNGYVLEKDSGGDEAADFAFGVAGGLDDNYTVQMSISKAESTLIGARSYTFEVEVLSGDPAISAAVAVGTGGQTRWPK